MTPFHHKHVLPRSIEDLRLSVRATNCLESEGIETIRDLVQRNEDQLLEINNFGDTALAEVKLKLEELGLQLGMPIDSEPYAVTPEPANWIDMLATVTDGVRRGDTAAKAFMDCVLGLRTLSKQDATSQN